MKDINGNYLVHNGLITNKGEVKFLTGGKQAYEVLRIIGGIPLFLEEHYLRLKSSSRSIGYELTLSYEDLKRHIKELVEANKSKDINVKILSVLNGQVENIYIYMMESFYPPENYYEDGIHTILYRHERENPNAKIIASEFRQDVKLVLDREKAFECILVDGNGMLQEGSRSNMFFAKDGKLYTAHSKSVLMGITRQYILKACEDLNIEVVYDNIREDEIENLEGGFMTGTSVNILPISSINNVRLNSTKNILYLELKEKYDEYVSLDLKKMDNYYKRP